MIAAEVVMAFFQKIKQSSTSKDDVPEYVESLLENSPPISNEEIDERFSVKNMVLNANYGIDHAIELLRNLPNENTDIVVSVVTKTLESANINVAKIIEDAQNKEQTLELQINQLNEEIEALQNQITQKKEQINVSTAILGETQKVKGLLESSGNAAKKNVGNEKNSSIRNYPAKPMHQSKTDTDTDNLVLEANSL